MSSLKCYSFIFTSEQLQKLRDRHITSILDFIQETPDNINKITNLRFKDILEIKEKLVHLHQGNFQSGLQLYLSNIKNYETLSCGIPAIEELLGELEFNSIYELCGLSGSGKTQICLKISASTAFTGNNVLYIDTKNDFCATKVYQIIRQKTDSKEDAVRCLKKITVTKVDDLYQLINALHGLKTHFTDETIPLIIIDCISTLYFLAVGQDETIGLGLLNHIASLIKFIKSEFHVIFILTNLAAKYIQNTQETPCDKTLKPCLGNYWSQMCDTRILVRKIMNSANMVAVEKDNRAVHLDLSSL